MTVDERNRLLEEIGTIGLAVMTFLEKAPGPATFQQMKNHRELRQYSETALMNTIRQLK